MTPSRESLHAARDLAILACVCAALALAAVVGAVVWAGED